MLKNIPNNFFYILLAIINQSLEESYFPKIWKSAEIVMISKTTEEKNNPNNYRPISLLSCLGKLVERVVKSRLYNYFEKNQIIIDQQSGFRANRRTHDNLTFLTQKIQESLNTKKKVATLLFDISKA